MFFPHIRSTKTVFQYASPKGCYHHPREIQKNIEEIEVIVAGHGDFLVNGSFLDVGPGGMLWYYPGDIVEVTSHASAPYNTIVFEFYTTGKRLHERPPVSYWTDAETCAAFCSDALNKYRTNAFTDEIFSACVYARLCWECMANTTDTSSGTLPPLMEEAKIFIANHFQSEMDVKDIAAHLKISVPHLYQLFGKHLHVTPLQLIMEHRFQRARLLLLSTDLPIKEVAFESGFTDVNNFCRSFKKHFGQTARSFRAASIPST